MNTTRQGNAGKSGAADKKGSSEPLHRQLQLMHEQYFRDVADACADSQSRYQSVQTEFERDLQKAYQSQESELFATIQEDYQEKLQSLYGDQTLPQQYAEAYDKYRKTLQALMAKADLDDMGFLDFRNLGQSLLAVSTTAMNLSQQGSNAATATATANDPFSPPG